MRWTTAYGFAFNSSDPDGDSIHNNLWLRFPGQIYYGIGSYNYNYFRDYDQLTGRYLESDPIGLSGGMNSYAYGASSPLVNVDRLGLVVCKCKATGGGAPIGNISKVCTYKCKCQCANDPSKWRSTTRLIPSTRYSQEETGFLCIGQRSIWVWRTEYNYGTGRTRKWRELEGVDFYPFVVDTDTSYVGDDDMEALRKTLETEDEVPCC